VNCNVPPPVLETVTCPVAALLPCASVKFSVAGDTEKTGGLVAVTVIVTGTSMLGAFGEEIVTLPVDVPTPNLPTSTETATDPGVVLPVLPDAELAVPGDADSQFPLLDAAAVKLTPEGVLKTEKLCTGGRLEAPSW
jgi:hypothetical protein